MLTLSDVWLRRDIEELAKPYGLDGDALEFTIEECMYWYAARNHSGQGSPLYAILSCSPYKPGPSVTYDSLDETTREIVQALEAQS